MKSKIINAIKQIDYKLYGALLLFGFLPVIYTTVRIHFLGDLPADWGFNIASQLAWVNVLYEVIQEAILLPIFYLMGKSLSDKIEVENKIRTGLLFTFAVYALISFLLIIFVKPLLLFMSHKTELLDTTGTYIRLESVASIFNILVQFLILILITIKKEKKLLAVLCIQTVLTVMSDTFFVSTLPFSLELGVNGIAYGNIMVNVLLLFILIRYLINEGLNIFSARKLDFNWMKEWLTVGGYSGLESFVRNFAFMVMVLRMVNVVGEQGVFWVANNFIWMWLLLPVLQLGKVIKRDCGEFSNKAVSEKTVGYFIVTTFIIALWVISIPVWRIFIKEIMNSAEYMKVFHIALISLGFYIIFAYNNVIDSIFYGIGKTNYMLFQSVAVNTLFYGSLFILYKSGFYKPTLNLIALMFAAGIGFDALLTFGMFKWMLKKRNLKLQW